MTVDGSQYGVVSYTELTKVPDHFDGVVEKVTL
jgi:hypothetical protein